MHDSVPSSSYSSVCNVLGQWNISLIPTYRVLEQSSDVWRWFNTNQFSYHCVHPIHAKMFSIQMLLHFSQIAQRVCTSVLSFNPWCACAARVIVLGLCVCVCVCVCVSALICRLTHWNHKREIPTDSSQYGNDFKKDDFCKHVLLNGIIC